MLDNLIEIWKQSSFMEAEESESKKRPVMVLKWTEGFGLIEASILVFEDIDLNEE
jgi:hypothetical protein